MKPFSGIKDIDLMILSELDDVDLLKICGTISLKNTYINHICSDQIFWKNRLLKNFSNVDLSKWKELSWKDKYLRIVYYIDKMKREYDFDFIKGDPRLYYIGLYLKDFFKYQRTVDNLLTTETLSLYGKNLTEIPKEIGYLHNLERLYLQDNQLKNIPKEIGNLHNLEFLILWDNQLTEIPKEIGNLQKLKQLSLQNNQLTEIPKELGNLHNLERLYLHDNKIKDIPEEIKNLPNLKISI